MWALFIENLVGEAAALSRMAASRELGAAKRLSGRSEWKLSEALPCGVEGQAGVDIPRGGLPVRGEGAPGWGAGRAGRDARSKCNDFSVRLAKQGQS